MYVTNKRKASLLIIFTLKEHKDFLQLMLEASGDDEDTSEDKSPPLASTPSKKRLTDDEVVITANMFLLAGYETTGSSLAFTAYLLAVNSDKQDQLCDAIDAFYEENEVGNILYKMLTHFAS